MQTACWKILILVMFSFHSEAWNLNLGCAQTSTHVQSCTSGLTLDFGCAVKIQQSGCIVIYKPVIGQWFSLMWIWNSMVAMNMGRHTPMGGELLNSAPTVTVPLNRRSGDWLKYEWQKATELWSVSYCPICNLRDHSTTPHPITKWSIHVVYCVIHWHDHTLLSETHNHIVKVSG